MCIFVVDDLDNFAAGNGKSLTGCFRVYLEHPQEYQKLDVESINITEPNEGMGHIFGFHRSWSTFGSKL